MTYREMYLLLFHRVTDALKALEQNRIEEAKTLLMKAQQDCEEIYIEQGK